MQSICFSLALFVVSLVLAFIPIVGWILLPIVQLGGLVLWIVFLVKAYQGKWFRAPIIGNIAAKQVGL